jgi:hypothetical protein
MTRLACLASVCLVLAGLAGTVAAAEGQIVFVPGDTKPFKVSESELVRLTGKGIAGSQITCEVHGPAKVVATYSIREVKEGHNVIGNGITQFDLKPSGKGKVKATVTVKFPTGGAPKTSVYTFEVGE